MSLTVDYQELKLSKLINRSTTIPTKKSQVFSALFNCIVALFLLIIRLDLFVNAFLLLIIHLDLFLKSMDIQ
jgi:hypothetical protein